VIRFEDIEYASLSDVGVRRSHNQDSLATLPANDLEQWYGRGHVFVVADGMGAHAVGELASKLAADSTPHIYSKHAHEGPLPALRKAFVETNLGIHTRGQQNREFAGMGTTGTALLIRPEGAWVGHVGDSRCYRIRNGKIQQLSFDHSLVWELARRQNKAPEELVGVPSNVIVRSLGPEPLVQVDVEGPHPIQSGDYYLLCSDGLSGQISDREIGAVISALPPAEACRFLINLANLQGGPDNITAIVVHVAGQTGSDASAGSNDAALPAQSGTGLARRLSPVVKRLWPLIMLFLGIVLAMVAIYLTAFEKSGDLLTFVLAAVTLLSGLAGLMIQNSRETTEPPRQEPDQPAVPRIYRQTSCAIEAAVIQRLVQAVETLEERIKEKNWQVNREACQEHRDKGLRLQKQGDLPGAFREDCRAMLLLMEAINKQRVKEESFKPLWDKEPPPNGRGGL
jgi:serine/threonine protein phosphatase PrpC